MFRGLINRDPEMVQKKTRSEQKQLKMNPPEESENVYKSSGMANKRPEMFKELSRRYRIHLQRVRKIVSSMGGFKNCIVTCNIGSHCKL